MNFGKQVKAQGILLWWGKFRYLWNSIAFYIQIMQFGSVLLLVFNDSIRYWIKGTIGIDVSFWLFIAVIFMLLMVVMVFEHKYTIPGTQKEAGEQFIKHSPFKLMEDKLNTLVADNIKIKEKLGIKDSNESDHEITISNS